MELLQAYATATETDSSQAQDYMVLRNKDTPTVDWFIVGQIQRSTSFAKKWWLKYRINTWFGEEGRSNMQKASDNCNLVKAAVSVICIVGFGESHILCLNLTFNRY